MRVVNRQRWERTKNTTAFTIWSLLLVLFIYRAANDIDTNFDLLSMVVAVSGVRMAKMIVENDRD